MQAQLKNLERAAANLKRIRAAGALAEQKLQDAISEVAGTEGLREWARSVGISVQYACDIRHRRRKVSDELLSKILAKGTT